MTRRTVLTMGKPLFIVCVALAAVAFPSALSATPAKLLCPADDPANPPKFYDRAYDCVKDEVFFLKGDDAKGNPFTVNGKPWVECATVMDNKLDTDNCTIHYDLVVSHLVDVLTQDKGITVPDTQWDEI